jgi:hypothetical protein
MNLYLFGFQDIICMSIPFPTRSSEIKEVLINVSRLQLLSTLVFLSHTSYSSVKYLHPEQVLVAFIVQALVHLTEISPPMISLEMLGFSHIGYICVRL